jgi:hypothetical protein
MVHELTVTLIGSTVDAASAAQMVLNILSKCSVSGIDVHVEVVDDSAPYISNEELIR